MWVAAPGTRNAPGARPGASGEVAGTAYRIRTDDLRLERAVSWASRRMRLRDGQPGRPGGRIAGRAPSPQPPGVPAGVRTGRSEAVRLEERAERLRHLEVALLPQHQAEVG